MFILKLFAGSYTRRTSIGKWLSLMSCSEPRLSSEPQWKWNCLARQMSLTPPPEIVINFPVKSICTVKRITQRNYWMHDCLMFAADCIFELQVYILVGQRSFCVQMIITSISKYTESKMVQSKIARISYIFYNRRFITITVITASFQGTCIGRRWQDKE